MINAINVIKSRKSFTRITLSIIQAIFDVSLHFLSFSLAVWLWLGGEFHYSLTSETEIFFAGTILAVFIFNSLYNFRTWLFWDEVRAVIKSSFLVTLVEVLYLYSQKSGLPRSTVLLGAVIFVPLCSCARYILRRLIFALGILSTDIMILGAGRTGKIFAEKITNHPFTLGKISGFLDDDDAKQGMTVAGFRVRGKIEDFTEICGRENIDEAAIAISTASRELLNTLLGIVEFSVRQVHYIPDMYMLTTFSPLVRDVEGMPVVYASRGLMTPFCRFLKFLADYAGGIIALLIVSPLMLYAYLRVKMRYGGEVLLSQERSGVNGGKFKMYKFRSSGEAGTDVTLRRSYIDELPQLFNVLRGEMSLVGPKALFVSDVSYVYSEETARKISAVKPGITGFWQISEHGDNDRKIRGEMELYYIRNWSLWLDVVIIIKTFLFVTIFRKRV